MTTKTLLSLATVSLLAFAAKAESYTVETTNSWFSVDAASEDLSTDKWTGSPTQQVSRIVVDTEAGSPVTYTPSEPRPTSSARYRVKGNMTVTLNADVPAVFTGDDLPKAALVAVAGSTNKWYGWNGDSWVDLSSEITTAPVEGTSYDVAIEFFVENSKLNIKYIVGTQSHTVQHSSLTALPTLTKVGLAGYGSFGDFGALGFESFEVTTTKTEEDLVAAGLFVDEGQTVEEALNSEGKNGLLQWQSLVLGIDPSSTTKPYTAPVQTNNGNLGFTIGNYGTPSVSGDVKFDVIALSGPNETTGTTVSSDNTAGSTAEVTAPTANGGVKYYKIKIKFQ